MKKQYEKPIAELVIFEFKDVVAAGCGTPFYNHTSDSCQQLIDSVNLADLSSCTIPLPEELYCYNNASEGGYFAS